MAAALGAIRTPEGLTGRFFDERPNTRILAAAMGPLEILSRLRLQRPSIPSSETYLEPTPLSQPRVIEPKFGAEPPKLAAVELVGGEVQLLARLQARDRRAQALLFDRYERDVRRVLVRILGTSPDVADALQDTFVRALKNVSQVKEALALRNWLLRVAVTVAFDQLRRRQRLRWLVFANDSAVDVPVDSVSPELRSAVRDTYRVLDKLPHEERVAFALRHIEEMELEEIADACGVSLSTIKRRLAKAEVRFKTIARRQPGLADWVDEEAFR